MFGMNYWAIIVAAVAAFVASTVWYIVFARQRIKLSAAAKEDLKKPQPLKMLVELVKNLVLAFVLSYFIVHLGVVDWMGAVQYGFLAWIGFPVILLTGSVMYENVPWKLAAIHAGDWLLKILLMAVILGVWR